MSLHLDTHGVTTVPDVPRLCWTGDAPDAAAVALALEAAGTQGLDAVSIGWDPMDAPGLAMLQSAGFKPVGTGPWRFVGGAVHWVTGYEDATGAVLDLICTLS